MIKDNQRLKLLVDELQPNTIIADIGTDHGYLPIDAVKRKKVNYAFAADVNEKPLQQAQKNIKEEHLEEKIDTILSDGLTYFKANNIHLDYVTISGLGSSTITEIMSNDYENIDNYIVCSNTEPFLIRQFVKKHKMFITKEMFFIDNKKKYWLMVINKNNGVKVKNKSQLFIGTDLNMISDKEYIQYLKKEYEKNKKIIEVSKDKRKNKQLLKINKLINKVV